MKNQHHEAQNHHTRSTISLKHSENITLLSLRRNKIPIRTHQQLIINAHEKHAYLAFKATLLNPSWICIIFPKCNMFLIHLNQHHFPRIMGKLGVIHNFHPDKMDYFLFFLRENSTFF